MDKSNLTDTPFIDALKKYVEKDITPFDVPGHHMGNIETEATKLFGHDIYRLDVNAPRGLDNLSSPQDVLLESEKLLAKATGADEAFYLINGTSSGILAMFLTALKGREKIILPRNVHKSVISALVISGAIPVYVMPSIDANLEIVNQPSLEAWKKAIITNPSAKAIFVINPTYFGSVSELEELTKFAHEHNMAVLVDEAHGAHYYFDSPHFPISAMKAGADMSAVSFHKTLGSLTQTSVLLVKGNRYSRSLVQKALNTLNSTSPSSLLIASLEASRKYLVENYINGLDEMYELIQYAREEINKIPGISCPGREYFKRKGCFDYDESKVIISIDQLKLDGFTLYNLLADKYQIQVELAEPYAVLTIFAIGTKRAHVYALINALKDISKDYYDPELHYSDHKYEMNSPFILVRTRSAFNAPGMKVDIDHLEGQISKESVMIYPPGIPLINPGEIWNKKLVNRISEYRSKGAHIHSTYNDGFEVIDVSTWRRFPTYQRRYEDYLENATTVPYLDGYAMPFEGDKHEATVILLPFRADTWRHKGKEARRNYKEIIKAISQFEKVIVGIHPSIYADVIDEYERLPNVEPIKIKYNDSWARDTMPLFVKNGKKIRAVDFRFNAWGGEVDGLYSNYKDDDKLSSVFAKKYKYVSYYHPSFVFEGGSIAVDGQGTAIVTKACLLSEGRNPLLSKEEIEENIKHYLGVNKVIWISHGIYLDETNEHVDNMVAFTKPGEVVLAWADNKDDPQYEYSSLALKELEQEEDALGRKLKIIKLRVPFNPLYESKEESKGILKGRFNAKSREEGNRLSASYVNFYQGKDFVIMPGFGVKEDVKAYETLSKCFPDKKVIQINTREVLLGGGNIHCITMQIPAKE